MLMSLQGATTNSPAVAVMSSAYSTLTHLHKTLNGHVGILVKKRSWYVLVREHHS